MGKQRLRFRRSEIDEVIKYVELMSANERTIIIYDSNKQIHTVIFFSICDGYDKFLKKPTWSYRSHDIKGKCFYIEKAVSKGWNREIRMQVQEAIIKQYPGLKIAKAHRYGRVGDREVTMKEYFHATV